MRLDVRSYPCLLSRLEKRYDDNVDWSYFIIIDLHRFSKVKIVWDWVKNMARSMKIYRFFTTKRLSNIFQIIENKKKNQKQSEYPRILDVQNNSDNIVITLQIQKVVSGSYEILFYECTLKSNGVIFLQGKTAGRIDVNEFLADLIENASRYEVIKEYTLTDKEMLKIFKNITEENHDNIILDLKVTFNPDIGYKHEDKEVYGKLSFQFIGDRCASKHRDFTAFLKDSKEIEMTFGLLKCAGLEDEVRNTHSKLITKSDCSFRMYREVPHEDWLAFTRKVLNFI